MCPRVTGTRLAPRPIKLNKRGCTYILPWRYDCGAGAGVERGAVGLAGADLAVCLLAGNGP